MAGETDVFKPETATENKFSINSALHQSYNQAKKHLQDGMNHLQDGMNAIKDEFLEMYDKAGDYLHKMVLPVNNFLKDFSQIDAEFKQELNKDLIQLTPTPKGGCGTIIPIEQAMSGMMEENY